jgi:hypothetical protein
MKRDNYWVWDDWLQWDAAGHPPLGDKQLARAARSVAHGGGTDPKEAVALAMQIRGAITLSQPPANPPSPARVPSNPTSSRPTKSGRTAGNPPKTAKRLAKHLRRAMKQSRKQLLARGADPEETKLMMAADADPDMQRLWLAGHGLAPAPGSDAMMLAAGIDQDEVRIMAEPGTDPELRTLWLAQAGSRRSTGSAPLGMDDDRYQLHTEAKQLAQTRCDANPRLDAAETYALAAIELADRGDPGVI